MDNLVAKQNNPSKIEGSNLDQSEDVENNIKNDVIDPEANIETEDFDTGDASQMEKDVVKSAVEKLKDQFGDKIKGLSLKAKQRIGKALVVLFLATTMAGVVPAESSYAAELDKDKDRHEQVGDRTEPNPEEILGFEVDFMTEEEANEIVMGAMDSVKTSGPDGERLVTHQAMETNNDFDVDTHGELPMEKENIIVRGVFIDISYEAQGDHEDRYEQSGTFNEVVDVENIEPVGEPFEIKGIGEQPQDAIRNALEIAGQRIEVSVYGHTQHKTIESGDSLQDEFSKHLQTSYEQAIDNYKVLEVNEVEQNGIKFFEAKINVQPGQAVK
ncbi:MAG: hypothetical protein Q8P20_07375 [bacterium]|nr:hypothetical protein [bacterium]